MASKPKKTTHDELVTAIREEQDGYTPCMEAPDLFFLRDDQISYTDEKAAKAMCGRCPVAALCLDYALDNNEQHGIWGGLGQRQRMSLKRREWDRTRNGKPLTPRQKPMV